MPELQEQIEALQTILITVATDGTVAGNDYLDLRKALIADTRIANLLPSFVRSSRTLTQFWGFIKPKFPTYAARRAFIYAEFHPLLDYLEGAGASPSDAAVTQAIATFDGAHIETRGSKPWIAAVLIQKGQ